MQNDFYSGVSREMSYTHTTTEKQRRILESVETFVAQPDSTTQLDYMRGRYIYFRLYVVKALFFILKNKTKNNVSVKEGRQQT